MTSPRKNERAEPHENAEWVPLAQACRELRISRLATLSMAIGGDLEAKREPLSGWIYITRKSLDAAVAARAAAAPPI